MRFPVARLFFAIFGAVCLLTGGCDAEESEFARFERMIASHWDNERQAREDARLGLDFAHRHPRRAMTYIPIENPNIEGRLFAILNYAEQGFDGPLQRLSLHRFRWSETDRGIVHEFFFLREPRERSDDNIELAYLTTIDESDVRINSSCAMYWRWQGDHFEGATNQGSCVTSSFTATPVRVEGHGELWDDRIVRHDANYSLDGERLPTAGGASPEVFDRVSRRSYRPEGLLERINAVRAEVAK